MSAATAAAEGKTDAGADGRRGGAIVHGTPQNGEAIEGLGDLWPRLQPILLRWREFNALEANIQAHQFGIVREGGFAMPSPFSSAADTCTQSYYMGHRFWYRFASREEYYWVTSSLLRAFALGTIYFPQRKLAVNIYPEDIDIDPEWIAEFEELRASVAKPAPPQDPRRGRRVVVSGFVHYMHMLLNELPALDRAAGAGLGGKLELALFAEPFGPTEELFPELAHGAFRLLHADIPALNREHRLLVGLGAWTITQSLQRRIRAVAARHAVRQTVAARDEFRASHGPVFWISVKSAGRTCLRQPDVLARLIVAVKHAYPRAGFIINGTSHPWNLARYGSYFEQGFARQTELAAGVIEGIRTRVGAELWNSVRVVSGGCVCDEIVWGEAADFYFCHGGTMQNKIGWLHDVRGMVHSSKHFIEGFMSALPGPPLEHAPRCYLVPSHLIVDVPSGGFRDIFGAERREPDYRFTSIDRVIETFLRAFRESQPDRGETAAAGR